jgi:hypothetical protein
MRRFLSFVFLLLPLLTVACSTPLVQYIGHSYPASESVDMYLLQDSIPYNYTVIGTLQAEAPLAYKAEELQAYVLDYAREHGAHGILIEGLEVIEEDPVHVTEITEKTKAATDAKSRTVEDSVSSRRSRKPGTEGGDAKRTTTDTQQDTRAVKTTTVQERVIRPRRLVINASLMRYE